MKATVKYYRDQAFRVKSTECEFRIYIISGDTVIMRYANRTKADFTTTVAHIDRALNFEVWEEIKHAD